MNQIAAIAKTVTARLGDVISGRTDISPQADPRVLGSGEAPASSFMPFYDTYFQTCRVPGTRVREMEYYDWLEKEIADVRKALDAMTTMAVTGNLAGGGKATYTIRLVNNEDQYPPELINRFRVMEQLIRRNAYSTTRTMIKYGSYMPEIEIGTREDGKLGVVKLRPIPPGTIFRNINNKGESNPDKYWVQIIKDRPNQQANVQQDGAYVSGIPQWRLPHFAVWSNIVNATETIIYGTSILQPFGAIGLKVHACLDAVVVARLSRAAMRYKWMIDVSDIKTNQTAIAGRMRTWKRMLSRATNLLNGATNVDSYENTAVPDADFFVPAADGLKWDLGTIDGDTNLARVGDIEFLVRFYFGALGVPPEYLGHERSQGGRSNLSQIDINFARTVRHIQMFGSSGWEHIVMVDMLLGGYDPRKYPIEVEPPPIGARDELLQAQIMQLQSVVLMNLRAAGFKLESVPRWVMEVFLGLDDELRDLSEDEITALIGPVETAAATASPSDKTKVREALSRANGDALDMMRQNIRMLLRGRDEMAGNVYRHEQIDPEELRRQVAAIVDDLTGPGARRPTR